MPIILREAEAAKDLDRVFKIRHKVFVEEEKRFENKRASIFDIYDTLPETCNILALVDEIPIGTIRVTLDNSVGIPASSHFDFGPYMQKHGINRTEVASVSWLCTTREYRNNPGLFTGLMKMVNNYMRRNGARHAIAPMHPGAFPALQHIGMKAVAPEFVSPELGVPVIPVHMDLDALPPGYRESSQLPMDMLLNESKERHIYRKGEVITRKGEMGSMAFIVIRGSARTVHADPGAPDPMPAIKSGEEGVGNDYLLGPGEMFGELSLLSEGPRVLTTIGHSREVDVMVWTHQQFIDQLSSDTAKAIDLAKLVGSRLRGVLCGEHLDMPHIDLIVRTLIDASRGGRESVDLRWLGAQVGVWRKQLKAIFDAWPQEVMVNTDGSIEIISLELLGKRLTSQVNLTVPQRTIN
mgnify:CR=1 FL=1